MNKSYISNKYILCKKRVIRDGSVAWRIILHATLSFAIFKYEEYKILPIL